MTNTSATQTASFALAAFVTLAAFTGVSGIASQQRANSQAQAQAPMLTAAVQSVVVIGQRDIRA